MGLFSVIGFIAIIFGLLITAILFMNIQLDQRTDVISVKKVNKDYLKELQGADEEKVAQKQAQTAAINDEAKLDTRANSGKAETQDELIREKAVSAREEDPNVDERYTNKPLCEKDVSLLIEDPEVYNVTVDKRTIIDYGDSSDEEDEDAVQDEPQPIDKQKKRQYMQALSEMKPQLYLNADNDGKMHKGHEWAVPKKKLRDCNTNCAKCFTNPHDIQNELYGTWLEDAQNTEIGSILPKFVYKEFDPDW